MIPNMWYAVLQSSEVPPGRAVAVERLAERLVCWRDAAGRVAVARDQCPHRGAALSPGRVCEGQLVCPFHGFRFDTAGACTLVPANGRSAPLPQGLRLASYPTWEGHGLIFLWWGQQPPEPATPPWFEDLTPDFSVATIRDPWRAHYSRAVENQLDAAHLPFVHHNTIGRGGKLVVDGPWVEWCDVNRLRMYVQNRVDDGPPARRPDEAPRPSSRFYIELILPNLWQNHLSPDFRLVVAFAPVNTQRTVLYLQSYQRFARAPGLRWLVNWSGMALNRYILHQDRAVVESQQPARSSLRGGELLIPADLPIIEYRRRRQELLGTAE
ncbi:MAG: aromatic ring-hydroxylating dioxygenase subunit alpha [Fimbriimonadaceae bacterium]|nr:aromatic ring-hydroxylating dioxygenase subunit alpha [Fimbriimonadaceae bacterium]